MRRMSAPGVSRLNPYLDLNAFGGRARCWFTHRSGALGGGSRGAGAALAGAELGRSDTCEFLEYAVEGGDGIKPHLKGDHGDGRFLLGQPLLGFLDPVGV